MCGRFTLTSDIKEMQQRFGAKGNFKFHPAYNIAPSRDIPVVREGESGREIVPCRWGLVPHWSKPDSSYKAINARAETLAKKPFFRDAYSKRRCLASRASVSQQLATGRLADQVVCAMRWESPTQGSGFRCQGCGRQAQRSINAQRIGQHQSEGHAN